MENIVRYFEQNSTTGTLIILTAIACVGSIIGKIRIKSFSLGIVAVLLVGMVAGVATDKFGIVLNGQMTSILKDFGLIMFVYAVGLQVGPSFFSGFKRGGLMLNMQAVAIVALGIVITIIIALVGEESLDTMAGIYSGAISSTPGLSAAQEAVKNVGAGSPEAVVAGYALTYPIGVIIPIVCCVLIRRICNVRLDDESQQNNLEAASSPTTCPSKKRKTTSTTILLVFAGILMGLAIGSISIPLEMKGIKTPFSLGNTGGALVSAIAISHIGNKRGWIDSSVTNSNGIALFREFGVTIFLALVGLSSGCNFLAITALDGVKWLCYGTIIAILPTLIVGLVARFFHKTNYFTLMGLIGGATTDTPALAYANNMASNHADGVPAAAYASVYPLTVFLRILTAQLLVVFMA